MSDAKAKKTNKSMNRIESNWLGAESSTNSVLNDCDFIMLVFFAFWRSFQFLNQHLFETAVALKWQQASFDWTRQRNLSIAKWYNYFVRNDLRKYFFFCGRVVTWVFAFLIIRCHFYMHHSIGGKKNTQISVWKSNKCVLIPLNWFLNWIFSSRFIKLACIPF